MSKLYLILLTNGDFAGIMYATPEELKESCWKFFEQVHANTGFKVKALLPLGDYTPEAQ